jgi:molybdenum cofactor cytidylyltransferase
MNEIAAILLAAGTSSRMGFPKQLLEWHNQPLLQYQIDKLCCLSVKEVVVVLGHKSELIQENVKSDCSKVTFLNCKTYKDGLSESLKYGFSYTRREYSGVLMMLADLPLIRLQTMEDVVEKGRKLLVKEKIPFSIQPHYKQTAGHPVFIGNFHSLEWDQVEGDRGAKPLLKQLKNKEYIETDDPGIIFDIDTEIAYRQALEFDRKLFLKR